MKNLVSAFVVLLCSIIAIAQNPVSIHVSGRYVLGPCGDTLIMRGVNYAPYNWGWNSGQLQINQIAQSGANVVRIAWYDVTPDGPVPNATYDNTVLLDSVLSKCIQADLIPIVELHDQTCQNSPANLIALSNWFLQPSILNLISQYQHSIILNIANEALYVNWAGNPTTAQNTFVSTYTTIINNLRNAGISVPIMIDGPDCGMNLDVLGNIGASLQNNDPFHNLIFSAHAYWYAYANNDSTQMAAKVNYALSQNIPFVFGEIANLQDDATMCQYTLNYLPLLRICKQHQLGWMAWSWDNDGCPARQITTNGLFNSLTAYGNVIVNNSGVGLATNPPAKSQYLLNNGCNSSGFNDHPNQTSISIYPNPTGNSFKILSVDEIAKIQVQDVSGKIAKLQQIDDEYFFRENSNKGLYLITLQYKNGRTDHLKLLLE